MKSSSRIGVALYEKADPLNRSGNWACEFRGEPFEFSSANDLTAQILWVTNCTYDQLSQVGLRIKPNIADERYFRTSMSQIGQELGIGNLSLRDQSVVLAEIVGCASEMARLQLGMTQYPTKGLAHAVGQLFGWDEPASNSSICMVAGFSSQTYTACERDNRFASNCDIFTFWKPRFEWASYLLDHPLPISTDLHVIGSHRLPDQGTNVASLVEWAYEKKMPIFAKVRIHALENVVGRLLNYGAGAAGHSSRSVDGESFDARNMREWCSLPELAVLAEAGDINVEQVCTASGWSKPGINLHRSNACSASYSYGLVAENLWVGMTKSNSGNGRLAKSLSTSWLQAVDRMECLKIAENLHGHGFEVMTYGYGRITVACPKSIRNLIPQIARENGLMYPAKLDQLVHLSPSGSSAFEVSQHLLSNKSYPGIIRLNNVALNELGALRATK